MNLSSYKLFRRCRLAVMLALVLPLVLSARESTLLDSGWRFVLGDAYEAQKTNFNDRQWLQVSVPHCWGWEDAQAGREFYHGPGWYRRALDIGTALKGKRYFLNFEAASSVANVYLNGKFLGEHRGAFGAFCFEITRDLSASGTNLLALRVSNAPEPDIAPLSGDFPVVYGGLYRPVHLIVTDEVNFALTDHASPGVAWLQTSVTPTQAVLDVTVQISNATRQSPKLTFVARVLDADGKCVARNEDKIAPTADALVPDSLRVVVPQAHLWNGRKDPYLYRAVVELRSVSGLIDSVEQPMGLRFFRVDPDQGFFLNGKPYSIYGVCRHQDRPDKGWAISDADMEQDVRLIKEIGATAVRCAHYQQSEYFYSFCDRAGLLVWAEIPQVDIVKATPQFVETSRNQLLDLVRQNINHPSIFVWSLFNELRRDYGSDDPNRELQDLNIVAHGEDPTRPTIGATCSDKMSEMNKIPDLLGWNLYPGWYRYSSWPFDTGKPECFGPMLDALRDSSRQGGICVSEYGAGANLAHHENAPPPPKPNGPWHPEEWQSIVHEADWAAIKARPFVWGSFVWNMFDFVNYSRRDGGLVARNDKGLVTFDRETKKDAFYFYQANWSDESVLHINSQRFAQRTNAVTDVKIYSNVKPVELLLNGFSLGRRSNSTNGVFIWSGVTLKPGENKVEARAERDGTNLADQCIWTLKSGR